VLLFGNDAHLLETRRWVLESADCRVYAASNFLALNQILGDRPIDLLILCHTLTSEECDRAESIARTYTRKTRVLVLTASNFVSCEKRADAVVNAYEGPKTLLETVDHLLDHRIPPEGSQRPIAGRASG
jgi:DNA-binding response OmpR family regulator